MQTVFPARGKSRTRVKGAAFGLSFPAGRDAPESGCARGRSCPVVRLQLRCRAEIVACLLFSRCFGFVIMMGG